MSSPIIGAIPAKRSVQLHVAIDFLTAFCHKEFDKVSTFLTDDYVHYVLPKSLGLPPSDKSGWIKYMREVMSIYKDFKFEVYEVVEGQNAVTLHLASNAKTTSGADYNNEYVFLFELTPEVEGTVRIKRGKEFVNSKYSAEFFPAERARQAAAAQTKASS